MLVLSRKIGQKICIGPDVELVVLDARHGRVRLGFAGSKEVAIRRAELDEIKLPPEPSVMPHPDAAASSGSAYSAPLREFLATAQG